MSSDPTRTGPDQTAATPTPSPQAPDPIAVDRAKMDYQAKLDREKIKIWSGTRWRELVWDRFVFSLMLAVVGGLALLPVNCYVEKRRTDEARSAEQRRTDEARETEKRRSDEAKALEKFKLDEAKQRFFVEKRLVALSDISSAMSDVTRVYFGATRTGMKETEAEATRREYEQSLGKAREVINRNSILFDEDFNADVDRYFETHWQMMLLGVGEFPKYRSFFASLSNHFELCCKQRLHEDSSSPTTPARMPIAPISYDERITMTPKSYLEKQLKHWKIATGKTGALEGKGAAKQR